MNLMFFYKKFRLYVKDENKNAIFASEKVK